MQKVWQSRPTLKQTIVTVVVCLIIGVLAQGFNPKALLVLFFGIFFLGMVTWRNYDPKGFEQYHNPREYQLRTERDELHKALKELTEAIEEEGVVTYGHAEQVKARELLDTIKNRYKPKTKAK